MKKCQYFSMIKLKKINGLTGVFYFNKRILKFPKREDIITDEDIKDLFLGLVELVKKNTELKVEQRYERLINVLKSELRDSK